MTRLLIALIGLALGITSVFLLMVSCLLTVLALFTPDWSRWNVLWTVPSALVSVYCIIWCARLLLGRPRSDGGLLSPRWLVGAGVFVAALPLASLVTGAYEEVGLPSWLMWILSFMSGFAVIGYSVMAQERRAKSAHEGRRARSGESTRLDPLKLIFVGEGHAGDLHWVEVDGDAESVNPSRMKAAVPEAADAVVSTDKRLHDLASPEGRQEAERLLATASVLIFDSSSVFRFVTRDPTLHGCILERCYALQLEGERS